MAQPKKFLFSAVLQACMTNGTDAVTHKLSEIAKSRQNEDDKCSSSNEEHSEDEKAFELNDEHQMEIDDSEREDNCKATTVDNNPTNRHVVDISLHVASLMEDTDIDCSFPTTNNNRNNNKKLIFGEHLKAEYHRYLPSTFQAAILYHIEWQRKLVAHRIGLTVMATAMGKTVLAIFDIERELNDIHSTLGIEYGIQYEYTAKQQNIQWDRGDNVRKCPCMVHDYLENELNIKIPDRLDRVTYPTYLANTNAKTKLQPTEITPFRLVFIVHTKAIRNSAYIKFKHHFQSIYKNVPNHAFIKVEPSTQFEEIQRAKFIFVLFQSFDRLKQQNNQILATLTHVIIDEVHHLLADTWIDVHKCIMSPSICPSLQYCLGMTATLSHRTDISGDKLKSLFSNIVYINFPWTVAKQLHFFPAVEYLEALPTLAHGGDSKTYAQYFNEFALSLNDNRNPNPNTNSRRASETYVYTKALNRFIYNLENSLKRLKIKSDKDLKNALTPKYIVNILMQYQSMRLITNQSPKKRILVFANTAKDASDIAKLCNMNGMKAGAIHYKVSTAKCEDILSRFRSGKLNVLVNVNVVNEGYDLPAVDCVIMARLTSSEIIFVQQLGRGLRKDPKDPNKQICVLDLALNLRRRWKVLQDIVSDKQVIEYILNFWNVSNFVGTAITMSPVK